MNKGKVRVFFYFLVVLADGNSWSCEAHDEESTKLVLTVTELTRHIKSLLEESVGFVWVVGEVSNLRRPTSGLRISSRGWRNFGRKSAFPSGNGARSPLYGKRFGTRS